MLYPAILRKFSSTKDLQKKTAVYFEELDYEPMSMDFVTAGCAAVTSMSERKMGNLQFESPRIWFLMKKSDLPNLYRKPPHRNSTFIKSLLFSLDLIYNNSIILFVLFILSFYSYSLTLTHKHSIIHTPLFTTLLYTHTHNTPTSNSHIHEGRLWNYAAPSSKNSLIMIIYLTNVFNPRNNGKIKDDEH